VASCKMHQCTSYGLKCLVVITLLPGGLLGIPLSEFYPFGYDVGDSIIGGTLHGSSPKISLSEPFPFYGKNYSILYVSMWQL